MKKYLEASIGFLVVIFVIFVAFYVFAIGDVIKGKNSYIIFAKFNNVSGISPGSDVVISGISIGKVYSVVLDQDDYYMATMEMGINNGVRIPRNSIAIITSNSFFSDRKYVKIEPSNYDKDDFLKGGEYVTGTQSSVNVMEALINNFLSK